MPLWHWYIYIYGFVFCLWRMKLNLYWHERNFDDLQRGASFDGRMALHSKQVMSIGLGYTEEAFGKQFKWILPLPHVWCVPVDPGPLQNINHRRMEVWLPRNQQDHFRMDNGWPGVRLKIARARPGVLSPGVSLSSSSWITSWKLNWCHQTLVYCSNTKLFITMTSWSPDLVQM